MTPTNSETADTQAEDTKTVVITGASRGIGAGIAKECIARGYNVAVCARTRPMLEEGDAGASVLSMAVDVCDEIAVQALCDEAIERFGRIDLWINNAGVLDPIGPLRGCASAEVQRHLSINVLGVFHGTKSFANHVRERDGEGVLINISSGASTSAYEGWGAYCVGKAGVDKLTEVVAQEEQNSGLRAHSIAPGIIDTDMQSLIRSCSVEQFPMVEKFHQLKADGAFSSASFVGKSLLDIAFEPEARPGEVCVRLPAGK
ncbi:MAG: SDR family NAD(P)-dependent oxidoreductase [Myxococcales bacterium]|nr:SDR family NAD(P)-dependent oxidoreductase [Myxococcales bacterium]